MVKVNKFIMVTVGSQPHKLFLNDLRGIHKLIYKKRPAIPSPFHKPIIHQE